MRNQKASAGEKGSHEGKGGRIFQGNVGSENGKGHDLMNLNSSTDGVGSEIKSPSQAKQQK